ncbi:hypothetical protein RUND412_005499 [Rhizina undulata]
MSQQPLRLATSGQEIKSPLVLEVPAALYEGRVPESTLVELEEPIVDLEEAMLFRGPSRAVSTIRYGSECIAESQGSVEWTQNTTQKVRGSTSTKVLKHDKASELTRRLQRQGVYGSAPASRFVEPGSKSLFEPGSRVLEPGLGLYEQLFVESGLADFNNKLFDTGFVEPGGFSNLVPGFGTWACAVEQPFRILYIADLQVVITSCSTPGSHVLKRGLRFTSAFSAQVRDRCISNLVSVFETSASALRAAFCRHEGYKNKAFKAEFVKPGRLICALEINLELQGKRFDDNLGGDAELEEPLKLVGKRISRKFPFREDCEFAEKSADTPAGSLFLKSRRTVKLTVRTLIQQLLSIRHRMEEDGTLIYRVYPDSSSGNYYRDSLIVRTVSHNSAAAQSGKRFWRRSILRFKNLSISYNNVDGLLLLVGDNGCCVSDVPDVLDVRRRSWEVFEHSFELINNFLQSVETPYTSSREAFKNWTWFGLRRRQPRDRYSTDAALRKGRVRESTQVDLEEPIERLRLSDKTFHLLVEPAKEPGVDKLPDVHASRIYYLHWVSTQSLLWGGIGNYSLDPFSTGTFLPPAAAVAKPYEISFTLLLQTHGLVYLAMVQYPSSSAGSSSSHLRE